VRVRREALLSEESRRLVDEELGIWFCISQQRQVIREKHAGKGNTTNHRAIEVKGIEACG
jgi:hypothetical protein